MKFQLATDWKKIHNAIGHACVAITIAANAAWQDVAVFQQYISAHWLAVGSGVLVVVAFLAHTIQPVKPDANVATDKNVGA